MSSYYVARHLIYILNHHNTLKRKLTPITQLVANLEILATEKVQRELRRGGREDASHDFPESYQ